MKKKLTTKEPMLYYERNSFHRMEGNTCWIGRMPLLTELKDLKSITILK